MSRTIVGVLPAATVQVLATAVIFAGADAAAAAMILLGDCAIDAETVEVADSVCVNVVPVAVGFSAAIAIW